MSETRSLEYRAEIDGLRAVAVIPVILFHAGISAFSGGFVGVDVFFVISGYLITTILITDLDRDRFSLVEFYERRARRILPALFLVCIFSLVTAWVMLDLAMLNKFGSALIGVGTFLSNVVFWKTEGYFAESAELNPLLHSWSLAVEEQFYVLFPIFLLILWRFGRNWVLYSILGLTALSFLISEWGSRNAPSANFYLAPSRAWELLAGSISAFIIQKHGVQSSNTFSAIGLLAVAISIVSFDELTPFPSAHTALPVIGVVFIVLFADKDTVVGKLLSLNLLVGVGLASYSAYLWHQPLLAFSRLYYGNVTLEPLIIFGILVATISLSYVTYRFLETPFRNRRFLSRSTVLTLSVCSLLVLIVFGILSRVASDGVEDRLAKRLANSDFIYWQNLDERKFNFARLEGELQGFQTIVVGSSRVMQMDSLLLGSRSLNLAVSGASIEDHVAFAGEGIAKVKPERMIIGLDPWLINLYDFQDRWRSVESLYNYWEPKLRDHNQFSGTELSYFSENAPIPEEDSLWYGIYKTINIVDDLVPVSRNPEARAKKSHDGSYIYNLEYTSRSEEAIEAEFDLLLNYAMHDFKLDSKAEQALIDLVYWAQKKNVEVIFVLPPYHPGLYSLMATKNPIILELETRFLELARKHGIEILGSYNPQRVGCTEKEFYDGMHPNSKCMARIIKQIGQ